MPLRGVDPKYKGRKIQPKKGAPTLKTSLLLSPPPGKKNTVLSSIKRAQTAININFLHLEPPEVQQTGGFHFAVKTRASIFRFAPWGIFSPCRPFFAPIFAFFTQTANKLMELIHPSTHLLSGSGIPFAFMRLVFFSIWPCDDVPLFFWLDIHLAFDSLFEPKVRVAFFSVRRTIWKHWNKMAECGGVSWRRGGGPGMPRTGSRETARGRGRGRHARCCGPAAPHRKLRRGTPK